MNVLSSVWLWICYLSQVHTPYAEKSFCKCILHMYKRRHKLNMFGLSSIKSLLATSVVIVYLFCRIFSCLLEKHGMKWSKIIFDALFPDQLNCAGYMLFILRRWTSSQGGQPIFYCNVVTLEFAIENGNSLMDLKDPKYLRNNSLLNL